MVVVFVVWGSAPAFAQSDGSAEARSAFESGTLAFNESRWQDCATEFERSFSLIFAPELLFNIGLCYQRAAGALPDSVAGPVLDRALAAYRRYVREIPDASDEGVVRGYIADLEVRVARIHREMIVVNPPEPERVATVVPAEPDPEPTVVTVARNEFPITLATGALTLVSTALAIGLGVHAQSLYASLGSTCGQTPEGCAVGSISEVGTFATGANIMWAVSGLALAGTSVGFVVEFTATDTRPALMAFTVGRSF